MEVNDVHVKKMIRSAFSGEESLTVCEDATSYNNNLHCFVNDVLPTVPLPLCVYFERKVEPLLRANMNAGCSQWTNNVCESMNHVLKEASQWKVD